MADDLKHIYQPIVCFNLKILNSNFVAKGKTDLYLIKTIKSIIPNQHIVGDSAYNLYSWHKTTYCRQETMQL